MPSTSKRTDSTSFSAPWSRQLKLLSTLSSAILVGISVILAAKAPQQPPLLYQVSIWLCPAIIVLCALFAVRGYRLQGENLLVLRPGWQTRIPLAGLVAADHRADATNGSIRLFGNGGFFAYTGLFRNRALGRYRAFATDVTKAVVLEFPDRKIVITPDNPEHFVELLRTAAR